MDGVTKLYLERAENELDVANVVFTITSEPKLQKEVFHLEKTQTFYSAAIAHAYYCIFYSAKAYLHQHDVKTAPPEEHRKVFEALKQFVHDGTLDVELLRLYEELLLKADALLDIFKAERKKRGEFTYQQIAQANREPAQQSIKHARTFFTHTYRLLGK